MDEFALIRQHFAKSLMREDVLLGIGDDCALLSVPEGQTLAVSLDTLVEGTHFPPQTAPKHIATRALTTAMSDLAAMGVEPLWLTLGLTLPEATEDWVSEFCESFLSTAERFQCALVGGDLTRGPLNVTVQVHGVVPVGQALKRSGALPDDIIYVTGTLGDGAAGLAVLQSNLTLRKTAQDYLRSRFYNPEPRLQEGIKLRGLASAAIDISDGLVADLTHICDASGVGAMVDIARLPISEHWRDSVGRDKSTAWALAGGDDYQLCFTAPRKHAVTIEKWIEAGELDATPIGKITQKTDILMVNQGKVMAFELSGYKHFD